MRLIIHDLTPEQEKQLLPCKENTHIISDDGSIQPCIGCFGCWIKTPGRCVLHDNYSNIGSLMGQTDEMILISRCRYGGFSPFVKNALDRCIAYLLPYFTRINGEMHHSARYGNSIRTTIYFYGEDITEQEKALSRKLAEANAVNYHGTVSDIIFVGNPAELGGKIS